MAEIEEQGESRWFAVIGRSLAYMCLHLAELRGEDLPVQGMFLEGLGLDRSESASLLGTTKESLGELMRLRRAKKSKRGKRGTKRKKARASTRQ